MVKGEAVHRVQHVLKQSTLLMPPFDHSLPSPSTSNQSYPYRHHPNHFRKRYLALASPDTFEEVKEGNTLYIGSVDIDVPGETGHG